MSKFQLILYGVFGLAIVGGVIAFALGSGGGSKEQTPRVVMWGTLPNSTMGSFVSAVKAARAKAKQPAIDVTYVEKKPEVFERELVEALALGKGPDMVVIPHEFLRQEYDKVYTIPFEILPERTFKDSFIEAAEMFVSRDGVTMVPLGVDPLLMYWNRNIFSAELLTKPPESWDQFFGLAEKLTKRDAAGNITETALPFGEFVNVNNAKETLTALMLQAGTTIETRTYKQGRTRSVLSDSDPATKLVPAEEALRYFTEFANPSKIYYSWNRSMPDSLTMFLGERSAVYFGFASELSAIREKNPNLNFDVTTAPQIKGATIPMTFGRIYGISILKSSKNVGAAINAAFVLASRDYVSEWQERTLIPPARRAELQVPQTDAYLSTFYKGAIMSRAWLDPDPDATYAIFKNMVESVTSGRTVIRNAVGRADSDIADLLQD